MNQPPIFKSLSTLQWKRGVAQAVIDELQLRGITFQVEAGDLIVEDRFEDFVVRFVAEQDTRAKSPTSSNSEAGVLGQVQPLPAPPNVSSSGTPAPLSVSIQPNDSQGMAIAGLVCGIVAFLLFPLVLGALGVIFGAVSWNRGNDLGKIAFIVSICGLVVGVLLGIAAFDGTW